MAEKIQFSDVDRLFRSDARGDIDIRNGSEVLRQRFINYLLTPRGVRLWRPEFGSRFYQYVQQPIDSVFQRRIQNEARKVGTKIDDIQVERVDFTRTGPESVRIDITITPNFSSEQMVVSVERNGQEVNVVG